MSRVDQYQIHVVAEGGRDCGTWLTFAGGDVDSEEASTRDGYGLPIIQLGGPQKVQNWTISRTYRVGRDPELYPFLRQSAGRRRFYCGVQLLDIDGHVVGPVEPYSGILKHVSKADVNTEGNEAMKLTLEFSADGFA